MRTFFMQPCPVNLVRSHCGQSVSLHFFTIYLWHVRVNVSTFSFLLIFFSPYWVLYLLWLFFLTLSPHELCYSFCHHIQRIFTLYHPLFPLRHRLSFFVLFLEIENKRSAVTYEYMFIIISQTCLFFYSFCTRDRKQSYIKTIMELLSVMSVSTSAL